MWKNLLTIDDLYQFCKSNNVNQFSSKDSNAAIVIHTPGAFYAEEENDSTLMPVKLKACHTGKNANKSGISKEAMENCKNSFKGKPILGAIYKTDTGEYEFRSHDMKLSEDNDGNVEVEYIEQPVGCISETADPYLEYDEENQKDYLMVSGNIFANYSKAGEILQRRRTCKCSVEISVNEMSYNAAEDYLSIDSFEFLGVTILGYKQDGVTEIQEGMKGSKITIDDFSMKNNSMRYDQYQDKLVEILDKLNNTLENFNKDTNEEGGNNTMNEDEKVVLEQEDDVVEETVVEAEDVVETFETESEENTEETQEEETPTSENVDRFTKTFTIDISHDDIRWSLYNLIQQFDEQDSDYYSIRSVFNDYFYMVGWYSGDIYKQNYSVSDDGIVALEGERQRAYEMLVSESEKTALETLRANYDDLESKYAELVEFKDNTIKEAKNNIFAEKKYEGIHNTKAFKKLIDSAEDYSVEVCREKADEILEDFNSYAVNFSAIETETPVTMGVVSANNTKKSESPYGGLFD